MQGGWNKLAQNLTDFYLDNLEKGIHSTIRFKLFKAQPYFFLSHMALIEEVKKLIKISKCHDDL